MQKNQKILRRQKLAYNVSILTKLEIEQIIQYAQRRFHTTNNTVNATHDLNPITHETEIKLGNGIKNDSKAIRFLSHETIHMTITELLDKKTSYEFDNLYYSRYYDKNNIFHDNYKLLCDLFTIESQCLV